MDASVAGVLTPEDMSFASLVLRADPIVKSVMAILVLFSLACWAIIVEKLVQISRALRAVGRIETLVESATPDELLNYSDPHASATIVAAGAKEWKDWMGVPGYRGLVSSIDSRVEGAMLTALAREARRIKKFISFLATVGSAGPFIGLFGTVWGIMNSFSSIAQSQDTSLAVVAPGIAEALLATGIGLVAAIPAVMAYNKFAADISDYIGRLKACIALYTDRLAKHAAHHDHSARKAA